MPRKQKSSVLKKQRAFYSAKKKQHRLKTQVIINQKDGRIICTAFGKGQQHDFILFKQSKIRLAPSLLLLADSGYQGIQKLLKNTVTPIKSTKLKLLTKLEKAENTELSAVCIKVENALAFVKSFKVFSTRYRNRRRRFGLRFNLFVAIYNLEINIL